MSWNREGDLICGSYMSIFPYAGRVTKSRVKYGGSVQHTVTLSSPIQVFGEVRETIFVDEEELVVM